MVTDLIDTFKMMMMMKIQNDHNSANFEATTSRFCMVIDLNDTYEMMLIMMLMIIIMMMLRIIKTQIAITWLILTLQHTDFAW